MRRSSISAARCAPRSADRVDAMDALTLGEDSTTSVSGAGLTMLYGTIADLTLWYGNDLNVPPTAPPEKRITLKAPTIDARSGAAIDLSGGATCWPINSCQVQGDRPTISPPAAQWRSCPCSKVSAIDRQQVIHLDGGYGIPAGDYAVLPASYALLPGAYRLCAFHEQGAADLRHQARDNSPTRSVVMAGWSSISGTGVYDQRAQTYRARRSKPAGSIPNTRSGRRTTTSPRPNSSRPCVASPASR